MKPKCSQAASIAYGFQPLAPDEDPETLTRVHGINERISVRSLAFGTEAILRATVRTVGKPEAVATLPVPTLNSKNNERPSS